VLRIAHNGQGFALASVIKILTALRKEASATAPVRRGRPKPVLSKPREGRAPGSTWFEEMASICLAA
jgi:hypothetical protein